MNYYIGIDGGGTSSKGVLVNDKGQIQAHASGGPSNINNIGIHKTIENLSVLVTHLMQSIPADELAGIGFGLSGAGRAEDQQRIKDSWLEKNNAYSASIIVHHDAFAAAMGASAGKGGVIAISGTGSIVYGIYHQKEYRAGGYGYLLGDEGSGYYIGSLALHKGLAHHDGLCEAPELYRELCLFYEVENLPQIVSKVYQNPDPKGMISSCCALVFSLLEKGNEDARQIIDSSNADFARQIIAVFKQMNFSTHILYPIGSLFNNPLMRANLETQFTDSSNYIVLGKKAYNPEIGMILACLEAQNQPISAKFLQNLSDG